MSCFIFNDYDNYVSGIFDSNNKIKEDKKKILISSIFKDTFKLVQIFLKKMINIYFQFDEKIKDLDKLFNFNAEDLKIIKYNDKYIVNLKKRDKTYYKSYLTIIMKFINNWENFILAIIKDMNEDIKKYKETEKFFKVYLEKNYNFKIRAKLHNNQQLYKSYLINFEIYSTIFINFNNLNRYLVFVGKGKERKPEVYLYIRKNINSFLTNINTLFKFNILPNTDKRIKILFSYFNCKINKKYEYLIEYKKMLKIMEDFIVSIYINFDISNLEYLNEFEDMTFIFYEFLNLCFVLLEDNIEF